MGRKGSHIDGLRQQVVEAREATRVAEREFLLAKGWEEQGTYNEVTWWYYEGLNGSEPQSTAVKYALRDVEHIFGRLDRERTELLDSPISVLKLSPRPRNGLIRLNVETLGDVIEVDPDRLLKLRNFGPVALGEISRALARYNLQLKESR